ncbi:PH domain-containing protein [Oceanobacillus sp. 1P07AA]|uniref:PH domain-containing protein n=1 Tax=Oceanobacillus sp. 1P07AA TaxID=3132293 RepID=UPI0039A508AE
MKDLEFKSEVDGGYKLFLCIATLILFVACIFPLIILPFNWIILIILVSVFVLSTLLILLPYFNLYYFFCSDHLFVKSGLFRFHIQYNQITKVEATSNFLIGTRAMMATKGIVIYYSGGIMGELKISPANQDTFLEILQERAPQAYINVK